MANVAQWDPFSGRNSLHTQLDDLFNNFLTPLPTVRQGMPAIDVYSEDDKRLVAEVHAPGFDKDDIDVNVHNDVLEIKAEKHEKDTDKKAKRTYMMRESHASFYRSIALPKHANADKVEASFNKGVLKVTVPFKELPKPKKVTIKTGK